MPPPLDLGIHWPLVLRLIGRLSFLFRLVSFAQGALNLGVSLTLLPEPIPGASLGTEGTSSRRGSFPIVQLLLACSQCETLVRDRRIGLGQGITPAAACGKPMFMSHEWRQRSAKQRADGCEDWLRPIQRTACMEAHRLMP